MIAVKNERCNGLQQGDIISDVDYIESLNVENGKIKISKITFPLVIVLTQECDLTWDYESRINSSGNQDKYLFSAIVAPLYNYEQFIEGEHLSELNQKMAKISRKPTKTDNKNLRQNETPRYHYIEFPDEVPIVNSIIDFKHYFTVNIGVLQEYKKSNYICTVGDLFRERISQRFANYLSRIGLPDMVSEENTEK